MRDRLSRARAAAAAVCDPEIPALTLEDLGVLRSVELEGDRIVVQIVPTYTGCPATEAIRDDLDQALTDADASPFEVRILLSPPWQTDWITADGRRKLLESGIAPPACGGLAQNPQVVPIRFFARSSAAIRCPRCDSPRTELLSEFGSTACKALYRCLGCAEPFDYFKPYQAAHPEH